MIDQCPTIVEALKRKGLCTKYDLLDADREVHWHFTKGPRACAPGTLK